MNNEPIDRVGDILIEDRILRCRRLHGVIRDAVVDARERVARSGEKTDLVAYIVGLVAAGPTPAVNPTTSGRFEQPPSPAAGGRHTSRLFKFASTPSWTAYLTVACPPQGANGCGTEVDPASPLRGPRAEEAALPLPPPQPADVHTRTASTATPSDEAHRPIDPS